MTIFVMLSVDNSIEVGIINTPVMGTLLERDSWILEQNPNCAP